MSHADDTEYTQDDSTVTAGYLVAFGSTLYI
jgi:hypothetical protein